MIEITIKDSSNLSEFDRAVKRFKKLCNNDGFLQETKERRYFEKPSDKRRRERKMRKK